MSCDTGRDELRETEAQERHEGRGVSHFAALLSCSAVPSMRVLLLLACLAALLLAAWPVSATAAAGGGGASLQPAQSAPLAQRQLQRSIESTLLEADAQANSATEVEAEAGAAFTLTQALLVKATGISSATASKFLGPINAAAKKYSINTAKRMAMFLAQIGHESGSFRTLTENLNYSESGLKKTFPKYFNAKNAKSYARNPQKIASRAYANRMGNGNEASGDGYKFRGRGLIQITGKENYTKCGRALGLNLLANPDLLTQPSHAAMSAAWYWNSRSINAKAGEEHRTRVKTHVARSSLKRNEMRCGESSCSS